MSAAPCRFEERKGKRESSVAAVAEFTEGTFIQRSRGVILLEVLAEYLAVHLLGPQHAGQTTIPLHELHGEFNYVPLDEVETKRLATSTPRALLAEHLDPAISDQVRHGPDLLSYIKLRIDAECHKCGRSVLAGCWHSNQVETHIERHVSALRTAHGEEVEFLMHVYCQLVPIGAKKSAAHVPRLSIPIKVFQPRFRG